MELALFNNIVTVKFIDPIKDAAPAKCRLNIAKSTDGPEWAIPLDNGGYIVQPVPAPPSSKAEKNNSINAKGNNQNERLFNLGYAISGAPTKIGINQLPKPPINKGMTKKNIIIKAWEVTITL